MAGWSTIKGETGIMQGEFPSVTENATYYAIFNAILRSYTITWKDGETTLKTEQLEYGTMPTYTGATPTKAPTLEHAYAFDGWTTEVEEVTGNATYTAQFTTVSVAFYSLTVKETIGINFYLDVKKYTEDLDAYVELEYNHNSVGFNPNVQTDRIYISSATQSEDMYKFSLSFASGQIADVVNVRLYSNSGELLFNKLNHSILTYCQAVINANEDAKLVNLCKSIIDYGKYSKEYFEYKTEEVINNSGLVLPESIASQDLPQGVTTEEELKANKGVTNLTFVRYSFVALSDVSIRIYFNIANGGNLSDYTITFTPPNNTISEMNYKTGYNDWGYYVEVYGIESININKVFTVTITHSDTSSVTINYSALNYIDSLIQKIGSSEEEKLLQQKNMCLAIYQYNQYAIEYFVKGNPWEII